VRSLDRILDRLAPLGEGADLVVGGDLNVAAGYRAPGDRIRMVNGERRLLDRLTGELGLVPCWQARHPGEPLAQTLRWSGDRSAPYHCDGIFVPRAWASRLESAEVLHGAEWEALSDHHPVVADVRVGTDPRR
jgi:endonuclease/exonuclease/phosphatase family metal-dependent hydrolase